MTARVRSFSWDGARGEMFAQWVLAQVATVVRVPREADIGIDLICTLAHPVSGSLNAGRTFGVQVKSHGSKRQPEPLSFGGYDKQGTWRRHEIDWLWNSDIPLFMAIVDRDRNHIRLYSTIQLWHARWQWGLPGMITFIPDATPEEFPEGIPIARQRGQKKCGDGLSYCVPLGPRIFEATPSQVPSTRKRGELVSRLESWIRLSYRNLQHFRNGIPFRETPRKWLPNQPPSGAHRIIYYNKSPRIRRGNLRSILAALAPGVCAFAQHCRDPRAKELEAILPLAELLRAQGFHRRYLGRLLQESAQQAGFDSNQQIGALLRRPTRTSTSQIEQINRLERFQHGVVSVK